MEFEPIQVALIAAAALIAGFGLARLTSTHARRLREVEGLIEVAAKEKDTADATLARIGDDLRTASHDLELARGELAMTREELEGYRGRVAEHFNGTSEQLRALAQQYSAVYRHLADGAADLCPGGFVGLESDGLEFLSPKSEASEPGDEPKSETAGD